MFISSAFRFLVAAIVSASVVAPAMAAAVEDFPAKPIRFILGFAPGGSADVMARLLAQKLSEGVGHPVVVVNRPGADGTIGAVTVVKAAPDGYSLLVASLSNAVISPLMLDKPYDPVKDFAPVTVAASLPMVLVVHPSLSANSIRELVALAKSKPRELNFVSGGSGTASGLASELFNAMAGVKLEHIPYNGAGPATTALLGGTGTYMITALGSVMPYVKAGTLKALAVGTAKRVSSVPQLPTIAEAGVPGYEVDVWNGVLAPAGTPKPVVTKLNREIVKVLNQPDFIERLAGLGFESAANTPEQFAAVIKSDVAKWAKVIKDSGARIK